LSFDAAKRRSFPYCATLCKIETAGAERLPQPKAEKGRRRTPHTLAGGVGMRRPVCGRQPAIVAARLRQKSDPSSLRKGMAAINLKQAAVVLSTGM
jgi:hypothetical protein